MFGIDNVGVINQRNAPAIWTSPIADFPPNNIQGRLLLATDTVTLYVDLINGTGGVTNRAIIASGLIGNGSGTTINNNGIGDYSVDLGGDLNVDTSIGMNNNFLEFTGTQQTLKILSNGSLFGNNSEFFPIDIDSLSVIIPDTTLKFNDISNNKTYAVLAKEL
jgi:hypothetical protein